MNFLGVDEERIEEANNGYFTRFKKELIHRINADQTKLPNFKTMRDFYTETGLVEYISVEEYEDENQLNIIANKTCDIMDTAIKKPASVVNDVRSLQNDVLAIHEINEFIKLHPAQILNTPLDDGIVSILDILQIINYVRFIENNGGGAKSVFSFALELFEHLYGEAADILKKAYGDKMRNIDDINMAGLIKNFASIQRSSKFTKCLCKKLNHADIGYVCTIIGQMALISQHLWHRCDSSSHLDCRKGPMAIVNNADMNNRCAKLKICDTVDLFSNKTCGSWRITMDMILKYMAATWYNIKQLDKKVGKLRKTGKTEPARLSHSAGFIKKVTDIIRYLLVVHEYYYNIFTSVRYCHEVLADDIKISGSAEFIWDRANIATRQLTKLPMKFIIAGTRRANLHKELVNLELTMSAVHISAINRLKFKYGNPAIWSPYTSTLDEKAGGVDNIVNRYNNPASVREAKKQSGQICFRCDKRRAPIGPRNFDKRPLDKFRCKKCRNELDKYNHFEVKMHCQCPVADYSANKDKVCICRIIGPFII